MQGSAGVNHGSNRLRAEKIKNKLARNIIAYFVMELIMPIGALVNSTNGVICIDLKNLRVRSLLYYNNQSLNV